MPKFNSQIFVRVVSLAAAFMLLAAGCGDDDVSSSIDVSRQDAVETYAEGVHSAYGASLYSAEAMDAAIDAFLASPSEETLEAARRAWLVARVDYGPTEVFRFYGGPIDDEETGTEGLINAWPLDEAYIDYVDGDPDAGIVNKASAYPEITPEVIVELNEVGGEANVSTGWHAIEFLLWGQDLDPTGTGNRPASDYTTAPNADRRAAYLAAASNQLIDHLQELVDAWAPGRNNYRASYEALDVDEALRLAFTGIGEMSRGELAGERMTVAYTERSQEDEHSCFSDNTTVDIIGNARGVEMVLLGSYPGGVSGVGLLDVISAEDSALAHQLRTEVSASINLARNIPAPFDQHLRDGVSDNDPGRQSVLATIEALETQTDTIVAAAEALGITINVS